MEYEYIREITVIKDEKSEKIIYFIKKIFSDEFNTVMYNVGVSENGKECEVENFSPSFDEAKAFADFLWSCNGVCETLFLFGEEFLERCHI